MGLGIGEYLRLPQAIELAQKNPSTTALIDQRAAEAAEQGHRARRRQQWVPLSAISHQLIDAVVISEDAAFYQHDGVDTVELRKALEASWEKGELGRGASTITMQLAKNLWLSTDRSLLRKLKELILTRRLEEALPKKRILAIYLNVVEWGDGVYGAEAGAREHFGVSASELSAAQAAMLAAMLPAPRKWTPARRSKMLKERSLRIIDRLASVNRLDPERAAVAREEIAKTLGTVDALGDAE